MWDPDAGAGSAALAGGGGTDCSGVWRSAAAAPYSGGGAPSVEDLQWSPNEATVFASAQADGSVRIWDTRVRDRSMLSVGGACDVNVLSWSRLVAYLLAR